MIVEDDPAIQRMIGDYFRHMGYDILTAGDGEAGVRLAQSERPAVMILDLMLPKLDGVEVCQRVRTDKAMDDVRIICISGMVEEDKIEDLKAAGANDFLHKPFEVETLIERMCSLLDIEAVTSR